MRRRDHPCDQADGVNGTTRPFRQAGRTTPEDDRGARASATARTERAEKVTRNRASHTVFSLLRTTVPSVVAFVGLTAVIVGILAMYVWMGGHGSTSHPCRGRRRRHDHKDPFGRRDGPRRHGSSCPDRGRRRPRDGRRSCPGRRLGCRHEGCPEGCPEGCHEGCPGRSWVDRVRWGLLRRDDGGPVCAGHDRRRCRRSADSCRPRPPVDLRAAGSSCTVLGIPTCACSFTDSALHQPYLGSAART